MRGENRNIGEKPERYLFAKTSALSFGLGPKSKSKGRGPENEMDYYQKYEFIWTNLGLIDLGFVSIPVILFVKACNLVPRVCVLPFRAVLQGKGDPGNKVKGHVEYLDKNDSIVLQKLTIGFQSREFRIPPRFHRPKLPGFRIALHGATHLLFNKMQRRDRVFWSSFSQNFESCSFAVRLKST